MTKPKPWSPLEVYESVMNSSPTWRWFWRLKARNGNIVCDGSQGYSSKAKALQGFRAAAKLSQQALKEIQGK